ncbi:MAG: hypothetical protein QXP80_04105 [Zestosphaera sp.]
MVQTETSDLIALSDISEWWRKVDVSKLDEDSRYRILYYLVESLKRRWPEIVGTIAGVAVGTVVWVWLGWKVRSAVLRKTKKTS